MRRGWIGVALATALLGALTWRPALRGLGTYLVVDDPLRQVDAVVVLSGDVDRKRLDTAVAIVQRRVSRSLLIVTDSDRNSDQEAQLVRLHAERRGTDADQVIIAPGAHSTVDDARLAGKAMKEHGWQSAIVVTSAYHTRRAQWTFRRIWGPLGLSFTISASRDSRFDPQRWWQDGRGARVTISEYLKLAAYMLRYGPYR